MSVRPRSQACLLVLLVTCASAAAETAQERYYRAYYLETAQRDCAAASKLYSEVAGDRAAPAALVKDARARLAGCQEELAAADFAKLMPPEAIGYVELNRPGDQLVSLLQQLGLTLDPTDLGGLNAKSAEVTGTGAPGEAGLRRVGVSPVVIQELLGMRGMAVAVTGFDPGRMAPRGVALIHPGRLEILRGLIESGLPAGSDATRPVRGFPTYVVESQAYVTLTHRFVIVASEPDLIAGVIDRLQGEEEDSFATNPDVAEVLKDRQDALAFFCVNARPLIPLIKGGLAAAGSESEEARLASLVLDPESLRTFSGRIGVAENGVYLSVSLRLAEDHENLVFNFLRGPAVDPASLRRVPPGVAALVIAALNDDTTGFVQPAKRSAERRGAVSLLDFGREVFANITTYGAFVLPPAGNEAAGIAPDAVVFFSVRDPARSQALWTQMLGIAAAATGQTPREGETQRIEGMEVREYALPMVSVLFAAHENDILIASSESAMRRTLAARRGGQSLTTDTALSAALSRIGPDTTWAAVAQAGRCAQIARRYMSPSDLREAGPYMEALNDTAAALVFTHSGNALEIDGRITHLPRIGGLVAQALFDEQKEARLAAALGEGDADEALKLLDAAIERDPHDVQNYLAKFDLLAVQKRDLAAARTWADYLYTCWQGDALRLNNFAWALLTEAKYAERFDEMALRYAKRADELTRHSNWAYLDTLALAKFKAGDREGAIADQREAIRRCDRPASKPKLEEALQRYIGERAASEVQRPGTN